MTLSPRVDLALKHLESARSYMRGLLQDLTPDEWFWTPQPPISHIAWQVGHLAVAEYGLMLFRQRGRQEVDGELMSGGFRKLFMKGTTASADRANHPGPDEIVAVLDRVHQQVLLELPGFADAELDQPIDPPHTVVSTRYGSMLFAGDHEMLHAGQIGMLRRLMGKAPVR